jgi:hypothetical protein
MELIDQPAVSDYLAKSTIMSCILTAVIRYQIIHSTSPGAPKNAAPTYKLYFLNDTMSSFLLPD